MKPTIGNPEDCSITYPRIWPITLAHQQKIQNTGTSLFNITKKSMNKKGLSNVSKTIRIGLFLCQKIKEEEASAGRVYKTYIKLYLLEQVLGTKNEMLELVQWCFCGIFTTIYDVLLVCLLVLLGGIALICLQLVVLNKCKNIKTLRYLWFKQRDWSELWIFYRAIIWLSNGGFGFYVMQLILKIIRLEDLIVSCMMLVNLVFLV